MISRKRLFMNSCYDYIQSPTLFYFWCPAISLILSRASFFQFANISQCGLPLDESSVWLFCRVLVSKGIVPLPSRIQSSLFSTWWFLARGCLWTAVMIIPNHLHCSISEFRAPNFPVPFLVSLDLADISQVRHSNSIWTENCPARGSSRRYELLFHLPRHTLSTWWSLQEAVSEQL
jgi:hypothetical protein